LIQPIARLFEAPDGGQRQFLQIFGEWQHQHAEHLQHDGQRLPDLGGFGFHVGTEQRLAHYAQRQPHHFIRDIQRASLLPAPAQPHGILAHHRRVPGHAVPMKRGLNQAALPQMKLAFAGQQPLAQQNLGALQRPALDEIPLIGHQNLPHEIRMVHQIRVIGTQPEIWKIAVLLRNPAQELDRPGAKRRQITQDRKILRAARLLRGQQHAPSLTAASPRRRETMVPLRLCAGLFFFA
jgi:hypothetical protein